MANYLENKIAEMRDIMDEYNQAMNNIRNKRLKIFERLQQTIDNKKVEKIRQKFKE
jgi:hypothetical protein